MAVWQGTGGTCVQPYLALIVIEDLGSVTSATATRLQPHLARLQQIVSGGGTGTGMC